MDFFEYWDKWHEQWWEEYNNSAYNDIRDWKIPTDTNGDHLNIPISSTRNLNQNTQERSIFEYFPEPYWINKDVEEFAGVFININPGEPCDYHILPKNNLSANYTKHKIKIPGTSETIKEIDWDFHYRNNNRIYSETIKNLIGEYSDKKEFWHYKKRLNWVHKFKGLDGQKLENIACFDLVPWHTKKASEVKKNINDSKALIKEYVIPKAIDLSSKITNKFFKNKIICYGSFLRDILNESDKDDFGIDIKESRYFNIIHSPNSILPMMLDLHRVEINGNKSSIICIHYPGSLMDFPNPESIVFEFVKQENQIYKSKGYRGLFKDFIRKL